MGKVTIIVPSMKDQNITLCATMFGQGIQAELLPGMAWWMVTRNDTAVLKVDDVVVGYVGKPTNKNVTLGVVVKKEWE